MLAFSNDYYGMIFRETQSVELFCAYVEPICQFPIFLFSYYDAVFCSVISELNCVLAQVHSFCNRKFSFL